MQEPILPPKEILEKIQKLLALANDPAAAVEEAASAMGMANRLLLKYNLELSQVETNDHKNIIIREFYDLNELQSKNEADWIAKLFSVICKFNMCSIIQHSNTKPNCQGKIALIGLKHNIDMVYYMVDQVSSKIRVAEKQIWGLYDGPTKRNAFKRGFFIGAIEGIAYKLRKVEEERKNDEVYNNNVVNKVEAQEMGLMIVKNDSLIKTFIQDNYQNLKAPKKSSYSGMDSRAEGRAFGKNIELSKGLSNNTYAGKIH